MTDSNELEQKEEVHLNSEDIELIAVKNHPKSDAYKKKFGLEHNDDCFALPLPYMRVMHEAHLFYKKGMGKHGKGYATSSYEISQEDPWFWTHFLGDPVMPGTQGHDAFLQLAGIWGAISGKFDGRPRALSGQFDFHGQILPTSRKIYFRMDVRNIYRNKKLIIFDGTIAVDSPKNVIYDFKANRIGYFTKEELGISQRSHEYYKPDWDAVRRRMLQSIDQAETYYKNNG